MNNITKSVILSPFNLLYKLSPRLVLQIIFRLKQGYFFSLSNPKTYNEKLQWIKLNDRNPLMPICCDKYSVREFVRNSGCESILNHLIWQGFNPEDIPFDLLPEKCVIKATHGSSFNIICKDTSKLDRKETIRKCRQWLNEKYLSCYGEWFYGVVKPRIVVEDFIESSDDEQLRDYKVFCFNGIPRLIRVDTDRFTNHKDSVFDCDWNLQKAEHMGHGSANRIIERPVCLDKLLEYSRKLSKPFLHARVDFYIVGDRVIFGEITFTNGAGFDRFSSYDFDLKVGNMLTLPLEGHV